MAAKKKPARPAPIGAVTVKLTADTASLEGSLDRVAEKLKGVITLAGQAREALAKIGG